MKRERWKVTLKNVVKKRIEEREGRKKTIFLNNSITQKPVEKIIKEFKIAPITKEVQMNERDKLRIFGNINLEKAQVPNKIIGNNIKKLNNEKILINKYFDHIYCLNLDRRLDKWLSIKKSFNQLNIDIYRFPAIDGDNISEDIIQMHPKLNKYEIGCMMSHYEIIKDAKKNAYEKILIFEDDIIFDKNFIQKFSNEIKFLNDWKLLYLGASQHDWDDIEYFNDFYYSKRTQGTFAIAIHQSIYDDILNTDNIINAPIDVKLFTIQNNFYGKCYTFYPNLIISDVSSSDIRKKRDINIHSKKMKWNLDLYDTTKKFLNVLLLPDVKGWAFDNIANAIIKYNPFPDYVKYTKHFIRNDDFIKTKFKYSDWDYVYVFFEGERSIPVNKKKLIKGCYSAIWLESNILTKEYIGEQFMNCRATIFVNEKIKTIISPYCMGIESIVINDAADPNVFFPINIEKNKEFTALFVGNINRKIKRFDVIKRICNSANIKLEVAQDISHDELYKEYNKANICINFSVEEGGPQTFFESALCGTPMLINNDIAMSKEIPCFSASNENDMIKILKKLKKKPEECLKVGKNAREFVLENYTYEKAAIKFSNFFLNLEKKDILFNNDITAFIISAGENPNYNDCINAINKQTMPCKVEIIKNYSPSSRAFQEMINRCTTKYYIQVDEDMILYPTAIETMYNSISNSKNNDVMVAHMLHDVHLNFNIVGIKIYKYDVFKKYPYDIDPNSPEIPTIKQLNKIKADGYTSRIEDQIVIGYHSPKWNNELIFERYYGLMEKYKIYGYLWLKELPNKLKKMYIESPTEINYFALHGAKASVNSKNICKKQKNFTITDENYLKAKKKYELLQKKNNKK